MNIEKLQPLADLYHQGSHPADWYYFYVNEYMRQSDFTGMTILDIGAGDGSFSCAISLLGAEKVIALEPEGDGATQGVQNTFQQAIAQLGLNIELRHNYVQDCTFEANSFDLITMIAVINHLDEQAVQVLHTSEEARQHFQTLLKPIISWLRPKGKLVIYDASRYHILSPLLAMNVLHKYPLYPDIEWNIHQQPRVWKKLLETFPFQSIHYHWTAPKPIFWVGKIPLVNALVSPTFVLEAIKAG